MIPKIGIETNYRPNSIRIVSYNKGGIDPNFFGKNKSTSRANSKVKHKTDSSGRPPSAELKTKSLEYQQPITYE